MRLFNLDIGGGSGDPGRTRIESPQFYRGGLQPGPDRASPSRGTSRMLSAGLTIKSPRV